MSQDAPLFGSRSTKRRRTRPARTHPCAGGGRRSTFGNLVDASDSPRVVGAQNRAQEVTPLPRCLEEPLSPSAACITIQSDGFSARAAVYWAALLSGWLHARPPRKLQLLTHVLHVLRAVTQATPLQHGGVLDSSSRLALSASKRRSDAGARHAQPESKLQVACVAWADTQDLLVDGSPGGEAYRKGARPGSLSPATVGCQPAAAGRLFASGLAPLWCTAPTG